MILPTDTEANVNHYQLRGQCHVIHCVCVCVCVCFVVETEGAKAKGSPSNLERGGWPDLSTCLLYSAVVIYTQCIVVVMAVGAGIVN